MNEEYKGYNGTILLTETGVLIKRGARGFLVGGGTIRGDKAIPYSSIIAVQFKKAGFTVGYIQLTLRGGSDAKSGIKEVMKDENTVTFQTKKTSEVFWRVKELIENKMNAAQPQQTQASIQINDLEKLAELKEKGVITESEFTAKKKQILDL